MKGRKEENMFVFKPQLADTKAAQYTEEKYLGDLDEIESYARDCFEEWHYFYPTKPLTIDTLTQAFTENTIISSLQYYHEIYKTPEALPVKRLFQKTLDWNETSALPLAKILPPRKISIIDIRNNYNHK
jgi:hypothetical protein